MTRRRKFAVIDSESDPFKRGRIPEPFIWGFYDGTNYEQFTDLKALPEALHDDITRDIDDFIPSLYDLRIIIYAHNGGKFDYHSLLDFVNDFEPIKIISGRLASFKIGHCEFRDSWNILPVPLAEYQKQKFDYSILEERERYKPHNWKRITQYLYSDCYNLFGMVNAFIDRHGIVLTQAGAAMKSWRKTLKQHNRPIPEGSDLKFYDDFQPYYYGGRSEVHKKGIIKEGFKSADLNSAYPRAMLEEHPCSLEYEVYHGWPPEDVKKEQCLWSVRAISRGALPYRDADKSLFFPNDTVERVYHVTGWEIVAGMETATLEIIEVLTVYDFDEKVSFKDFILPLWEHRKAAKVAGNKEDDLLDKLEMNALYGKHAANPTAYKEYMLVDPEVGDLLAQLEFLRRGHDLEIDALEDFERYKFAGMLGPKVLGARDLLESQMRFYNVVTAASITGYVRAVLWRGACKCRGLIYMDTDAITAHDISALDTGKELGQWDIEGNYSEGAVAGKKMYAFKYTQEFYTEKRKKWKKGQKRISPYKMAHKGVKFRAWQIYALCRGQTVIYDPQVPSYIIGAEPKQVKRRVVMNAKTAKYDLVGKV